MLCSKCSADLPEGSQFCLKCGKPVSGPAPNAAQLAPTAILACSRCGRTLPEGAQVCPRCGKPVSVPAKSSAAVDHPTIPDEPAAALPRPRKKRHIVRWVLLAVFVLAIIWVLSSDSPTAQAVQEMVGWKHDQQILDATFSISPHTFRYYKFSLPAGSVNVAVIGQFETASDNQKEKDKDVDNNIEVYVLSEGAFTVWQNGYATSSLYESGRVAEGTIRTELPAGEGIYYLIFSNKFAPRTAKNVHASALLRYKSWLPEWFRRMKDRFWNWIGL